MDKKTREQKEKEWYVRYQEWEDTKNTWDLKKDIWRQHDSLTFRCISFNLNYVRIFA